MADVRDDETQVVDRTQIQERLEVDPDLRRRVVQDELASRGLVAPVGTTAAGAAFAFGIVAVLAGLVPVLFAGALLFGLLALVLGMVGTRRSRVTPERPGRGAARAGMLLGVVGIVFGVIGMLITGDVIDTFDDEIHDVNEELRDADRELGETLND